MADASSHSLLAFSCSCAEQRVLLSRELAQGRQLLSLKVSLFHKVASYDQHLISTRVPEDSGKDNFILTDSLLHKL